MIKNKTKNLVYLFTFTGALFCLKFLVIDKAFPNISNDAQVWFTSGLLLIVLGVFVTEKFFTKPLDVIVNIITLAVVLSMLDHKDKFLLFFPLSVYLVIIALVALVSFVLIDQEKDRNHLSQRIANSANIISGFLGSSKMLFSIVFILSIFSYFIASLENDSLINKGQIAIMLLIIFWGVAILMESIDKKLITPLLNRIKSEAKIKMVGKVIKRLSPNIVYVEQSPYSPVLKSGDLVFVDDIKNSNEGKELPCMMYISEQESENKKYLQFYCFDNNHIDVNKQTHVFKSFVEAPAKILESEIYVNRENIIGFVYSDSDIDVIKVKMIEGVDEKKELKEGDLISVNFYKNHTKYQIINVETEFENIDGQSKKGVKIITAQQIGYWQGEKQKFADTGWVPSINMPVFIENQTDDIVDLEGNFFRVGIVPRSKYPIYVDLDECVTHHIAIIGKTGTGKSYMASRVIEKMAMSGYKIIVLEVDRNNSQSLSKYIDSSLIEEQGADAFNPSTSTKNIISIALQMGEAVRGGGTVNFSDMAAELINKVIAYQTGNPDTKICVVMEEAYDFIPENSFGKQEFGQPNVSRISQQVLKCRKHNIGFLIITQRTALVTKTILYQCHTIIALQSFDETSKNFMGAYINGRYLDSMSILPKFRAIVVGKGSTCDKPVIVDFFDSKASKNN
jgi:hypothetical protein